MAKIKSAATVIKKVKAKKNGKGIHAKAGTSTSKTSKNYKKPYSGQGK
jgi:hypothetical protein